MPPSLIRSSTRSLLFWPQELYVSLHGCHLVSLRLLAWLLLTDWLTFLAVLVDVLCNGCLWSWLLLATTTCFFPLHSFIWRESNLSENSNETATCKSLIRLETEFSDLKHTIYHNLCFAIDFPLSHRHWLIHGDLNTMISPELDLNGWENQLVIRICELICCRSDSLIIELFKNAWDLWSIKPANYTLAMARTRTP